MSKTLFNILGDISSFIALLPLLVAAFKFKSLNNVQQKLLYILIVILIVESISTILWYQKINNLPVYHFYTVIEFLLIMNIYVGELSQVYSKQLFVYLSIIFTVFAVINTIFFQNLFTFNSNVTTALGVIVVLFALSYFYKLLKEVKYSSLETNPMFWINSGFLIYFSSNLMLFFINNNLFKESTEASYLVWGLHAVVNIILIIFYTIAVWVNPKKQ
ncbi:hypothetical protein M0D21_10840 [Aquimarina sp. D1M17]|uniref:hypothetical protein n=1 Tax=Aquimarina acroporae TaxID=2937283 RepID=UPI0020C16EEE|nr:hypothetical protein [Aquimarina acroporae]MCK8522067.1 hypothetical protein [Aquimarina acroporae]